MDLGGIDFDKLEAKIASVSRLSMNSLETSGLNSTYTSEDGDSDDSGLETTPSKDDIKSTSKSLIGDDVELNDESVISMLLKLDANTKSHICQNMSTWRTNYRVTNYIPKSMRQFFGKNNLSYNISTHLLKCNDAAVIIEALEESDEVKALNRTATPTSVNLSFTSQGVSTPTLGSIDNFISELEQEADMESTSGKNNSPKLVTGKKSKGSTKTPASKLKISSNVPEKSSSPKNKQQETHDGKTSFESNNSTVADIHTDPDNINLVESPSVSAQIKPKSSAQIDQNTQRSSSQSERKIRFVREKLDLENEDKVTKQILSHVDKMIVREDTKIKSALKNKKLRIVNSQDHSRDAKNNIPMLNSKTPGKKSKKLIGTRKSSPKMEKGRSPSSHKTSTQHTLRLTPKKSKQSETNKVQITKRTEGFSDIEVTGTVEVESQFVKAPSSPSKTVKATTSRSSTRKVSKPVNYRKKSSRPVNSQDELNILLRDAIKSKRSLFGMELNNFQDIFLAVDKDSSGTIDFDEFQNGIKRLGIILTDSALCELMNIMDPEGNGFITYKQWIIETNKVFKRKEIKRSKSTASHKVLTKKQMLRKKRKEKLKALESTMLLAEAAASELDIQNDKKQRSRYVRKKKKYKRKSKKNSINAAFYHRAMLWKQELKQRNDNEKFVRDKRDEEEWETLRSTYDVSKHYSEAFDGAKFYASNLQWKQRRDVRNEKMKKEKILDELAECDFELSTVARKNADRQSLLVGDGERVENNPAKENVLAGNEPAIVRKKKSTTIYYRQMRWRKRKTAQMKEMKQAKHLALMSECTFAPELKNKEHRSMLAAKARKRKTEKNNVVTKPKRKEMKPRSRPIARKSKVKKKETTTETMSSKILSSPVNSSTLEEADYLLRLSSKFVSQSRKDRIAMGTVVRKAKRQVKKNKKK